MITQANVIHQFGSPEVFSYEDIKLKKMEEDEVLIHQEAIGVNYIDTYFRSGLYPWNGPMPFIVGAEAAGTILEIGSKVTDLKAGDRIAYTLPHGAYSKHRIVKAERVVKLPNEIAFEEAAAIMLKGLTVHYLLHRTFKVQPGHKVLIHAAAGGVGLLAGQWASKLGAEVFGTTSSKEKADLALANGYHHVINYSKDNFVEEIKKLTDGQGVDVVYDSVGQDTYPHSLHCLKRLGHWVSFGQSSGLITNFDLRHLAQNGSLTATRPGLFDYIFTRNELVECANSVFTAMIKKDIKVVINQRFNLKDAGLVHKNLEERKTKGSTVLFT